MNDLKPKGYKGNWQQWKTNKFTQNKRCGYSVDFQWLETLKAHPEQLFVPSKTNRFLDAVLRKMYELSSAQKDPLAQLIEKEEETEKEKLEAEAKEWLPKAMERLPKNQQICLYFRFGLDSEAKVSKLRSTNEIAKILGVCQATVYRHIQRGLEHLKKDFNRTFKTYINRDKIQIYSKKPE